MSGWKQKRTVMRRYNLTAEMYDARYEEEQETKYKAALETLSLNGADVILDVGCGTGLFFKHAAEKASLIVGVDLSRNLLLKAAERGKAFGNVHVVLADADQLPFRSDFFRLVFAFTVLQNMPKPEKTLAEMSSVTAQEGYLVVTALKRAFSLEAFGALLDQAGLLVASLRADEPLQCYVVVAVKPKTQVPPGFSLFSVSSGMYDG